MKPIDFPQSTKVLQRPGTMSESECQSLPVWNDGKQCVSCWKPTIKERLNILLGGHVWLGVMSGKTQPPVFVTGERFFESTPIKAHLKAFLLEVGESIAEAGESLAEATKMPKNSKRRLVGALCGASISLVVIWLFRLIMWIWQG